VNVKSVVKMSVNCSGDHFRIEILTLMFTTDPKVTVRNVNNTERLCDVVVNVACQKTVDH